MSRVLVRYGLPDERTALEDLQRRASLMWEEYRPYLLANPDVIDLPLAQLQDNRVRVAQVEDRRVGFAALLPRENVLQLDGLFVEPDCWRRGIGRLLVADAAARARTLGAGMIEVVANPRAEGFYARLGFAASGAQETPFRPANRMRLLVFPA